MFTDRRPLLSKKNICKWCCKFFDSCLLWPKRDSQRPRLLLQLLGLFIQVFHFANTSYPAPHRTKVHEPLVCLNECLTAMQCFLIDNIWKVAGDVRSTVYRNLFVRSFEIFLHKIGCISILEKNCLFSMFWYGAVYQKFTIVLLFVTIVNSEILVIMIVKLYQCIFQNSKQLILMK